MRRQATHTLAFAVLLASLPAAAADIRPSAADAQLHDQIINNALSATARVRAAVEDFHMRHNAFPSGNADIGLDPATWATPDIKSVTLGTNGLIEITLAASSGIDDGVIRLMPTLSGNMDENKVDWACTSPNYNTIADTTNGFCEYSKLP